MADWVHCNTCYAQPSGDAERKFFLTSCGHVFCFGCLEKGATDPACKICNQQAATIEINRQLRPDLQQFFVDPRELAKKHERQLRQVLAFQTVHRERYTKHCMSQLKHAGRMVQYFQQETQRREDVEKKYEAAVRDQRSLRDENRQLKDTVKQLLAKQSRSPKTPKMTGAYRSDGGTPGNSSNHSLNNTPSTNPLLVSFDGVTTSTPANNPDFAWATNRGGQDNPADAGADLELTQTDQSEVTTPKMLGLKKTPNSGSTATMHYEQLWNSVKVSKKSPSAARPRSNTPTNGGNVFARFGGY